MKKLAVYAVATLTCATLLVVASPVRECKCKNIPLFGCVKVVNSQHADFRVRVVDSQHADLRVKTVSSSPRSCGEWQFVDSHPDFTVRFVDSHADFTIRYVEHHSGMQ